MNITAAQVPPIVELKYRKIPDPKLAETDCALEVTARFEGVPSLYVSKTTLPLAEADGDQILLRQRLGQMMVGVFLQQPPARKNWHKPGAKAAKRKIEKILESAK